MELIISSGSVSYDVKDCRQSSSIDMARASMALLWCCISQSLQATAGDCCGLLLGTSDVCSVHCCTFLSDGQYIAVCAAFRKCTRKSWLLCGHHNALPYMLTHSLPS